MPQTHFFPEQVTVGTFYFESASFRVAKQKLDNLIQEFLSDDNLHKATMFMSSLVCLIRNYPQLFMMLSNSKHELFSSITFLKLEKSLEISYEFWFLFFLFVNLVFLITFKLISLVNV